MGTDDETEKRVERQMQIMTSMHFALSSHNMTEEGEWTLESYVFDDIEVTTPTPDVAVIAYTVNQNGIRDGKSHRIRAADSSTWIRGADGWECHAHSETFLEHDSAAE